MVMPLLNSAASLTLKPSKTICGWLGLPGCVLPSIITLPCASAGSACVPSEIVQVELAASWPGSLLDKLKAIVSAPAAGVALVARIASRRDIAPSAPGWLARAESDDTSPSTTSEDVVTVASVAADAVANPRSRSEGRNGRCA